MPTEAEALNTPPPIIAYAQLLVEMHRLIGEGKGDSEEAEALADHMDTPWYAMIAQEQTRMRGLAADLHALREGGPRRVDMAPEELANWRRAWKEALARSNAGDEDATLAFLRRPVPSGLPAQVVPYLQAHCWDKLGDLETALVFMRAAERADPEQAFSVMVLLEQLEHTDELPVYAKRVIDNPASTPLELYVAATVLLAPTRRMSDANAAADLESSRSCS